MDLFRGWIFVLIAINAASLLNMAVNGKEGLPLLLLLNPLISDNDHKAFEPLAHIWVLFQTFTLIFRLHFFLDPRNRTVFRIHWWLSFIFVAFHSLEHLYFHKYPLERLAVVAFWSAVSLLWQTVIYKPYLYPKTQTASQKKRS